MNTTLGVSAIPDFRSSIPVHICDQSQVLPRMDIRSC